MQRDRTLQYWDSIHAETIAHSHDILAAKEWILQPTNSLLQCIVDKCFLSIVHQHEDKVKDVVEKPDNDNNGGDDDDDNVIRILEIGCGTSCLSRNLYDFLVQLIHHDIEIHDGQGVCNQHWKGTKIELLATDVSDVCIDYLRQRDAHHALAHHNSSFNRLHSITLKYDVLNVVESHPPFNNRFDLILDKGCIDTFLFRSRCRGSTYRNYGPIIQQVLHNIQSWLRSTTSIYAVMTSRQKHKSLRDYRGFETVGIAECLYTGKSVCSDEILWSGSLPQAMIGPSLNNSITLIVPGELEGQTKQNTARGPRSIYLHRYRKRKINNPILTLSGDVPSSVLEEIFNVNARRPADNERCPACNVCFYRFRKGETLRGRGEQFWFREWRGHCIHCKG
jgi:hypothetical protein